MGAGAGAPAGWYPDVERSGGERYWDGAAWTEHRRDPPFRAPESAPFQHDQAVGGQYGGQPVGYGPPPVAAPVGYQPYGSTGAGYPKSAVAGWALGLSIAGLVLSCCGGLLLSIPGAIMGWGQMQAVDRGERDPAVRGTAKAAFIVGIIGLAVGGAWLVLIVLGAVFDAR